MTDMELTRHAEALRKRVDRLVIKVAREEEKTRRATAAATAHARSLRRVQQELELERGRRQAFQRKTADLLIALVEERRWNRRAA